MEPPHHERGGTHEGSALTKGCSQGTSAGYPDSGVGAVTAAEPLSRAVGRYMPTSRYSSPTSP
jgi:hypothetical protein